jgi:hypothetical protein
MLSFYLNLNKYNVAKDLKEQTDLNDLYEYKKTVLTANGFPHLVQNLANVSSKFTETKYDEEGVEEALDVQEEYPVSLEDEKAEILRRVQNLEYVGKVHKTFEHCRTKCKVLDQRLRNFTVYGRENQMCVADCLNVRTELYNAVKPGNAETKEKTFVWLS